MAKVDGTICQIRAKGEEEDEDTNIKTKKAIADDNGNILTPRTRSGRKHGLPPTQSKTKSPSKQRTRSKKEEDEEIDEDELLAGSDDSSNASDDEKLKESSSEESGKEESKDKESSDKSNDIGDETSKDDELDENKDDKLDENKDEEVDENKDDRIDEKIDDKILDDDKDIKDSVDYVEEKIEESKDEQLEEATKENVEENETEKVVSAESNVEDETKEQTLGNESEKEKVDDNKSTNDIDEEDDSKDDDSKDSEATKSEPSEVKADDNENESEVKDAESLEATDVKIEPSDADTEEFEMGELRIVEKESSDDSDKEDSSQDRKMDVYDEETPRGTSLSDRTCQYCDAVKKSPADLQRHLRKHTGERPFKCQMCNRMFKAKRSLQYHQFMHHGIQTKNSNISQKYSLMRKRKLEMDQLKAEITNSNKKIKTDLNSSVLDLTDGVIRRHDGKDSSTSPESGGDMEGSSDRICQICGKICLKPSDLKRHMMSHTGERPFKCDICGKPFRAKNSMLYHQKSAHGLDIELSPGLEERFMKLKKQNQLNAIGLVETDHMSDSSRGFQMDMDCDLDDTESFSDEPSLSKPLMCSTSRKHQLFNSDRLDEDEDVEESVELDEATGLFKSRNTQLHMKNLPDSSMVGMEIIQESNFKKTRITVQNETVLVTRLDGINTVTKKDISLYKCYLCGKLFNYLSKVQCHLSMHFEKDIVIYQCELCKSSFWFKNQVMQHIRKKHPEQARQGYTTSSTSTKIRDHDDASNSDMDSGIQMRLEQTDEHSDSVNSDSIETNDKEESGLSISQEQEEDDLLLKDNSDETYCRFWRGLKYRKNVNGSYVCLVCRKSFHREISLLKHIKIHSTHKMSYCQECGKGFSEYNALRQHLSLFHNKSQNVKPHIRPATKSTLLSNLLRKTTDDILPDRVSEEIAQAEKAREMLIQEGIHEDVTVVLPCGPEDEPTEVEATNNSSNLDVEKNVSEKKSNDTTGSIQTAPKRSLIPEAAPSKSKRKSSQPVKLNSEDRESSRSPFLSTPRNLEVDTADDDLQMDIDIKKEPLSPKSETSSTPPPVPKSQLTPSQANPHVAQFLMAPGAVMNPALNSFIMANSSASSGIPQPTMLLSNAAFLPHMTTAGGISIPVNQVMMPVSVQVPNGDKAHVPGSKEPSPSPVPNSPAEPSPSTSGSGSGSEREQLVGFPRVQWSPNDASPSNGNWQWNTIATDGRKVTSLSRTHSRLPIVNAPVNRDKVCKPTQLSDGRQVYRCPFCSKDFLSYSDINRHMDFHEDIRPYKCKYCDYYARTNSQLKVHMMRHQGIREFCCKVCNYKGVTQSDLNRHMKSQIHILKSRNECNHCGEGFVTPKNLEKHQDGNCIVKVQKLEYSGIKIEVDS